MTTIIYKGLSALWEKPAVALWMSLVDLLFFASVVILGAVFSRFTPADPEAYAQQGLPSLMMLAVLSLAFFGLVILAYSAAKNVNVRLIRSIFSDVKISMDSTMSMFLANIALAVFLGIALLVAAYLASAVSQKGTAVIVSSLLLLVYIVLAAAFANAVHFMVGHKHGWQLVISAASFAFNGFKRYVFAYLWTIVIAIAVGIAVIIGSLLLVFILPPPYSAQLANLVFLAAGLAVLSASRVFLFIAFRMHEENV